MNQTSILANLGASVLAMGETKETVATLLDIVTALENTTANIDTKNAASIVNDLAKSILRADIAINRKAA